jgi:hypothetical protein
MSIDANNILKAHDPKVEPTQVVYPLAGPQDPSVDTGGAVTGATQTAYPIQRFVQSSFNWADQLRSVDETGVRRC